MPKQVLFCLLIEAVLMTLTVVLLVQPQFVVKPKSKKTADVMTYFGFGCLSLTFCWSFVFGCVLAVNQLSIRI